MSCIYSWKSTTYLSSSFEDSEPISVFTAITVYNVPVSNDDSPCKRYIYDITAVS